MTGEVAVHKNKSTEFSIVLCLYHPPTYQQRHPLVVNLHLTVAPVLSQPR